MSRDSFNAAHLVELERLAKASASDPILGPQDSRRLEVARALTGTREEPAMLAPRVAIFLRGGSVDGTRGIDATLAGQTLTQAGRMFSAQALQAEREAAPGKNRPRGSAEPRMLFTNTPRGSFGFEFAPTTADDRLVEIHGGALDTLLRTIQRVAEDDAALSAEDIPPKVLSHLKLLFRTFADHGVDIRLVDTRGDRRTLEATAVARAAERLSRKVVDREYKQAATFRGLTLESRVFDLLTDDDRVITGTVSEELDEAALERLLTLHGNRVIAYLVETTIERAGSRSEVSYTLTGAEEG